MKIVTVNVPESYISAINKLVGNEHLFPSRSELIRAAVREFIINELVKVRQEIKIEQIKESLKEDEVFLKGLGIRKILGRGSINES